MHTGRWLLSVALVALAITGSVALAGGGLAGGLGSGGSFSGDLAGNLTVTGDAGVTGNTSIGGVLSVGGVDDPYLRRFANGRRSSWAFMAGPTDTTLTQIGFGTLTVTGTASAQPSLVAWHNHVRHASAAATNGLCAGYCYSTNITRATWRPRFGAVTLTDSTISLRRAWFGLTESSLTAVTHATGPTASAVDFVALGFDTSISANWRICSGDGTNYSCADVPSAAVVANTEYQLWWDWSVSGIVSVIIRATTDGATYTTYTTTKATNLSTANTQNLALMVSTTTLADTVINHNIHAIFVDQN